VPNTVIPVIPAIAEIEDRQANDDEDLVEPLEQFEGFIEAGHVGAHGPARASPTAR
jgi:hypothetical protein